MAYHVKISGFDDLYKTLNKSADGLTGCMKRTVYAGAEVVADEVRSSLNSALKGTGDGGLQGALDVSKIKAVGGDVYTRIGFGGYDSHPSKKYPEGQPFSIIAAVLESGRSKQPGRAKTHFFSNAINSARKKAKGAMQEEFDKSFNKTIGE